MKKLLFYVISFLLLALAIALTLLGFTESYLFLSLIFSLVCCLLFVLSFEGKISVGRLCVTVTVSVCAVVGRIVFSLIPQVQPVTALVILLAVMLGGREAMLCSVVSAFLSNLVLGQGPWTLWQILAWGSIGLIFSLFNEKSNKYLVAVLGGLSAFYFSIVTDIYTISAIGHTLTFKSTLLLFSSGIAFNIAHAIFNALLIVLLFKPFAKMILRIKNKYPNLIK